MTHCERIQEILLTGTVDKTASPDETALINAHLPSCEKCRDILKAVTLTQDILAAAGTERPEPPPHVWANIQGRIEPEEQREPFRWNFLEEIFKTLPRTAWAGFAVLLILALGVTPAVVKQSTPPLSEASLAMLITTNEDEQTLFSDTINFDTNTEYLLQTEGETI